MIRHLDLTPRPPPRVVVLGASGFVGRDLVRQLKESDIETKTIASSEIDLRNPEAPAQLRKVIQAEDALVMVSAVTPDKGKDVRTFMDNLRMGEGLALFFEKSACSQVVYISSDAVYAESTHLIREDSSLRPGSFHGLMHMAREQMLSGALQKSGIPFLVLRPCALYGPEDTHNSYGPNRFVRTARNEKKITLFGQGEEKRDHVYIRDLSQLIERCLSRRTTGVLNLATGSSLSFGELAYHVAELSSERVEVDYSPRTGSVTHRHFDITELLRAFPTFHPTPLREGLSITWEQTRRPVWQKSTC